MSFGTLLRYGVDRAVRRRKPGAEGKATKQKETETEV
jgi:hypothetical protein